MTPNYTGKNTHLENTKLPHPECDSSNIFAVFGRNTYFAQIQISSPHSKTQVGDDLEKLSFTEIEIKSLLASLHITRRFYAHNWRRNLSIN